MCSSACLVLGSFEPKNDSPIRNHCKVDLVKGLSTDHVVFLHLSGVANCTT